MEIIRKSDDKVIGFLGGWQKENKNWKYRFNKYVFECDFNDVKLLYNCITGAVGAFSQIEYDLKDNSDHCFYRSWLIENYFLVPDNFNEDDVVDTYRNKALTYVSPNYLDKVTAYTIFTTLKCNARCFYCYELNKKGKKHMTIEIAEKLVQYIINHTFEQQTVRLDWFGGEPLFNQHVIDYITTRIKGANRRVNAGMISNGYLFDQETINKARNSWNLESVQITLDGTEKVYNKTKSYIYKDDLSPFNTVISNIHNLIRAGIRVNIRLNIDNYNMENMEELVNYLCKEFEFEKNRGISIYIFQIFEINGYERTPEQIKELANKMIEINHILNANGFGFFTNDIRSIQTHHCMIDSNDCVTVDPDGRIGVCEHHYDKWLFSSLDKPDEVNLDSIKHWQTKVDQNNDMCNNCKLKPACLKVPNCPSFRICRGEEKKYQYDRISLGLIQMYNTYMTNLNNPNCNGNCCNLNDCNVNDMSKPIIKCKCNCESNR